MKQSKGTRELWSDGILAPSAGKVKDNRQANKAGTVPTDCEPAVDDRKGSCFPATGFRVWVRSWKGLFPS